MTVDDPQRDDSAGEPATAAALERRRRRRERRAQRRNHPWFRVYRRHVRPLFSKRLSALSRLVMPALYQGYSWLVWRTSRLEGAREFVRIVDVARDRDGCVGLLWHEEVFTVAYAYPALGIHPHTLASVGEAGEMIARMLLRNGFVVFRGGSTTGRSRRREGILDAMIDHMRTTPQVIYGLTVDGSKGPPYRMKSGGIIIARECGKPLMLARTWYKRMIRLPTWDRMAIPLPFNVISYSLRGPFEVPAEASTPEGLERFRRKLEAELIELAAESYANFGQKRPTKLVPDSPVPSATVRLDRGAAAHLGTAADARTDPSPAA